METRILFRRDPSFLSCPDCGAGKLTKSRARTFPERIIKRFSFYRPYRCKNCGWRGHISSYAFRKKSFQAILLYFSIVIISLIIASVVMQRVLTN